MALDVEVTTATRVKTYRKVAGSGDDALIADLVTSVSSQFQRFMDRELFSTERTEYFDVALDQRKFYLHGWPVDTGETISVWNDLDWDFGSGDLLDSDEYTVLGDDGTLAVEWTTLEAGPRSLKVTYTGGMAATTGAFITAYPDIALAGDMQVAYVLSRRGQEGLSSHSVEGGSITIQELGLLTDVKRVLTSHRRRVLN